MPRRAVGANNQPGTKVVAQLPPPHFKHASSGKFVIVKMSVNEKCFHGCQKKIDKTGYLTKSTQTGIHPAG
jgi:hypothetical protein